MVIAKSPFRWPGRSAEAASLLASGVSWEETQRRVNISLRQLAAWHRTPEFQQRVEEHRRAAAEVLAAEGIANRQNQLRAIQVDWDATEAIRAERAIDAIKHPLLGGRTGFVVRKYKTAIDADGKARTVIEEGVDTGLIKARLDLLERAAKVAGWGGAKVEMTGKDGGPVRIQHEEIDGDTAAYIIGILATSGALGPEIAEAIDAEARLVDSAQADAQTTYLPERR
jgi:hypothetical protein